MLFSLRCISDYFDKNNKITYLLISITFLLNLYSNQYSAPLRYVPQTIIQPNGDTLHCFASGDEYYNWLHDKDDYTIIQDSKTGYYVYAVKLYGELVPSSYIAGKSDPKTAGLVKGVSLSAKTVELRKKLFSVNSSEPIINAPTKGILNNIVVFIRFSDESEFQDAKSVYEDMFNSSDPLISSMYNYYKEVSYNQLSVHSTFYPTSNITTIVSYKDNYPRNYYQPYNQVTNPNGYTGGDNSTDRSDREKTMLRNALNHISSQIPSNLNVDVDNNGYVDNVCFIVKGAPNGWNSLLWPHMWSFPTNNTVNINGKKVIAYNLQLQSTIFSAKAGVLSHEMFHSLGAPDLYHYTNTTAPVPVGPWDLMENNLNPPQHMTTYMKYRYGKWLDSIPLITSSGTYSLNPVTSSTNNCYKIASPNSSKEYFIIEYRRKTGVFEKSLPGEGLIVYRINTAKDGYGNAGGPPDEVYVYRPGGTLTQNGILNNAGLSGNSGRTAIDSNTDPKPFLSDGTQGGLKITNIGAIGNTIAFTVGIGSGGYLIISGKVTDATQTAIPGVILSGLPGEPVTDKDGLYSVQVPPGWSGAVIPQKAGCTFNPEKRIYTNLTADKANENYSGMINKIYSISIEPGAKSFSSSEGTLIPVSIKIGVPNAIVSPDSFSGVSFKLKWDNGDLIGYNSYTAGEFLGDNPLCLVQGFTDYIEAGLSRTSGAVTGSGIAITCTLKVLKTLVNSTVIKLSLSDIVATQSNGKALYLASAGDTSITLINGITVWPGDADNNAIVNVADVLAIGLNYGKTGTAREGASRTWQEQICNLPWVPVKATYADCDGNGTVNSADVLAIGLNYGKVHPIDSKLLEYSMEKKLIGKNQFLFLQFVDQMSNPIPLNRLKSNDEFYISVRANEINNIFGLCFEVNWTMNDANNPSIKVFRDWEDNGIKPGQFWGNKVLCLSKLAETDDKISVGLSKVDDTPTADSESELIRMKMKLMGDTFPIFSFENIKAVDKAGNQIELSGLPIEENFAEHIIPEQFRLYQNYPNPFNPETNISFDLPEQNTVSLKIYDLLGREAASLIDNEEKAAGRYTVKFNAGKLTSGQYFYIIKSGSSLAARKLVILK